MLVDGNTTNHSNTLNRVLHALFRHDLWNIGIVRQSMSSFLWPGHPNVEWLPELGRETYLADPFSISMDDQIYLFCEEFSYRNSKARIVVIRLAEGKPVSRPEAAIELPVHVSYPYLIQHKKEFYCVPETSEAREVGLYTAEEFPYRWVKVATMLRNFAGVDSTIFYHEGRWWLTCTNDDEGSWHKLYVFHSRDLYGPWIAHVANPVKTSTSSSRPAGVPFLHRGHLIRPAQDCSETYGGGIKLNRVLSLTPDEFREETISKIEPFADSPYPNGVHTISPAGDFTLVDGKRFITNRRAFVQAIRKNLGKVRPKTFGKSHIGLV